MSFIRHSSALSLSQLAITVITFVSGVIYTRGMGPEGIGQYALLKSSLLLAVTFGALGTGPAIVYFTKDKRTTPGEIATNSVKYAVAIGFIVSVFFAIALAYLPNYFGSLSARSVALISTACFMQFTGSIMRHMLVAHFATLQLVLMDGLQALAILIPAAIVISLGGQWGIHEAFLYFWIASALRLAVAAAYSSKFLVWDQRFSWKLLASMLKFGVTVSASNILYLLTLELSIFALRTLSRGAAFSDIAFYTRAGTICGLIAILPRTTAPLLFARWAHSETPIEPQLESALRVTNTYGAAALLGIILFGKQALQILYGSSYVDAYPGLVVLSLATVVTSNFVILNKAVAAKGFAHKTILSSVSGLVALGASAAIWVPRFGVLGAAMANLTGMTVCTLVQAHACSAISSIDFRKCLAMQVNDVDALYYAFGKKRGATR